MRKPTSTTIATYAVLSLAGVFSFSLPESLLNSTSAQPAPDELKLTGVVRDFRSDHPDFDVALPAWYDHYAGNVSQTLVDGVPAFTAAGYEVATEWTDTAGRNIAPNLFGVFNVTGLCYATPGVAVDGLLSIDNQGQVDSFDSRLGPYGDGNVGSDALISTNSTDDEMLQNDNNSDIFGDVLVGPGGDPNTVYTTQPSSTLSGSVGALTQEIPMPALTVPSGLGPSIGDVTYLTGTVTTINSNLHVKRFTVEPDATILIDGDVTILCDGDFMIQDFVGKDKGVPFEQYGKIELLPDSSLTIYMDGSNNEIAGEVNFNTGDPTRCVINLLGSGDLRLRRKRCHVVAQIVAPDGTLSIQQGAEFYGTFVGDSLSVDNQGEFHVDIASAFQYVPPPDSAGSKGAASTGDITSAATFAQWFDDVLGVNLSASHLITLPRDTDGFYEYSTSSFYPIDGQVFGNDADGSHNSLFSYAIDASFVYEACVDQMIEFEGDGDTWIYINGELVMDLGGKLPGVDQYVELDRLGLTPGESYQLLFLHARRHIQGAGFRLRTNIPLRTTSSTVVVTAAFD